MKSKVYRMGYSLERLRDLEMVKLTTDEARHGSYFHESLQMLFRHVFEGVKASRQQTLAMMETVDTFEM